LIRLRKGLLAGLLLCLAYLLAGLVGAFVPGPKANVTAGDDVTIHLVRGPIHYDLLLPLNAQVRARFDWLAIEMDHPGADFLVAGWGGEAFYTTTGTYMDVSPLAVWKGVTGDRSVVRVSLAGPFQQDWPTETLVLSHAQFDALLGVLEDSFATRTPLDVPGFSQWDQFYPAKGRFHIFQTCNAWIGQTLRAAGLRFGVWTPTPYAVTLSARHLSGAQR
jgi:uncharacterized protein (TIGR02117 family)